MDKILFSEQIVEQKQKDRKIFTDDSFISVTETKLDYLYKAVSELNASIKDTETKFWAAREKSQRDELRELLRLKKQKRDQHLK